MAAMLGNSAAAVVVVVVRTRPRAIPLTMITMGKLTHGFPFLSYMSMGLRFAALRAAGAPLITDNVEVHCLLFSRMQSISVTSSERTNSKGGWVQRVLQAVTTDVLHLGKYGSITQTMPFHGGYSQRGHSE